MGRPKALDEMVDSFFTSRKTAASLPQGLVDSFSQVGRQQSTPMTEIRRP